MANTNKDELNDLRHSLAHLLAAAVMELWPDTKRAIGPAIDNGFYFDFEFSTPITEAELPKIETKMRQILPSWTSVERHELTATDAKAEYPNNPYKQELIDEFTKDGQKVTFYKSGNYWDLCKGGHIDNLSKIDPKSFKLDKLAGAYWRGDEKNQMLTRIYGLAFATKKDLSAYLNMLQEAKKRDHRKLGQELDLFVFSDLVGGGLPLFTPRGSVLREELSIYTQQLRANNGFERVWTPNIAKTDLYKASGHWDKFGDELFLVKSQETTDEFVLKPMNCPHHIQIYSSKARSYRDLPIKYMENAVDYRDEKTGELHGLSRVRVFTQDDSHAFVRLDQIEEVATELVEAAQDMYKQLDMNLKFRLSFRDDGKGYLGDPKVWDTAQATIEKLAKDNKLDYVKVEGEAAFYGPKIDFIATDALNRDWQVATVQLDFVLPERFGLSYTNEQGVGEQPVMIHCALLGSIERFLAVYIEHTAGKFPTWLSPEQIRIITVNQEQPTVKFAQDILDKAKELGLRVNVDNSNESVGKKIRSAELLKIPYTLVIGEKEIESGKLNPRIRADMVVKEGDRAIGIDEFLKTVANEVASRTSRSSL